MIRTAVSLRLSSSTQCSLALLRMRSSMLSPPQLITRSNASSPIITRAGVRPFASSSMSTSVLRSNDTSNTTSTSPPASTTSTIIDHSNNTGGGVETVFFNYRFGRILQVLKAVSVTSCVTSLCAAPVLAILGKESVSVGARITMALLRMTT